MVHATDHTPTPAQRAAIEAPLGPVLVVAGPGAGKTFCLIGRIERLIGTEGLAPDRILAVTFTNKAAEEISRRLRDSLGSRADDVTRGTLHALCVGILREHGEAIGIPRGFGVADENYQDIVLRRLGVRRARVGQLMTFFGRRRLQGYALTPGDERLFREYVALLRQRNLLDFDDLIAETATLFQRRPEIARAVASRWDYVLVDEFQDLNPKQYGILKVLVLPHRNFFAVGDDEQSIFSWAGADPLVLSEFARDFGIERPIVLDQNRRCSQQIFRTARRLLVHNPSLFDKELRAERASAYEVRAYGFEDDDAEFAWILADLRADRDATKRAWGDYALLYRKHEVGHRLESGFVRAGIPCRLARGRALLDDPVIAFVVASLRLMSRPDDPDAVEAAARQVLPAHLVERIRADLGAGQATFYRALRTFAQTSPRQDPDTKRAWRFIYHAENLAAIRRRHDSLAGMVEEFLAQRVGPYRNALEERAEELSDPAEHPEAVALARRLELAPIEGGRVLLAPAGGLEIALKGMLLGAGVTALDYLADVPVSHDSDVLIRDTDPLIVFKALQLFRSRDIGEAFGDYVAFDLETTDRDPATCEIIEIGAARVRAGVVVDQFHSLIRPTGSVSAKAREVHGYDDHDLRDAPPFAEVWPRFRAFAGQDVLVAHNGQNFDVPLLRRQAAPLGGADDLVFFDTLPLARSICHDSARLPDLATRFGVERGREHHALDDALTLAGVVRALEQQKVIRARKAALVNLVDYLGLAFAVDRRVPSAERAVLAELAVPFVLGRFSDAIEFYATERALLGADAAPPVEEVIERLGGRALMERIRTERGAHQRYPEAMARLRALIDASRGETFEDSVRRLLERVALSTSEGAEADPHRVNLLTLHSTKGLEFSRVYVVGVEDYQIPGYYAVIDNRDDEVTEARRLLYVGMTRAEDRLVLTRADRRAGRDTGGSRFLEEMELPVERVAGSLSPLPR